MPGGARASMSELLRMKSPMSVAIYDDYNDASRAVDYLADRGFPVENLAIVGTDLKSVEKVTGQLTWPKVLLSGFAQGSMWALMFALILFMIGDRKNFIGIWGMALLGFGVIGMAMAALEYRLRGPYRDYTSTRGIVANHYEILAEHTVANRARELLGGGQTRLIAKPVVKPASVDLASFAPPFGQQPTSRPRGVGEPVPAKPVEAAGQPVTPNAQPADEPVASQPVAQAEAPTASQPAPSTELPIGQQPYGSLTTGSDEGIGTKPGS